MPQEGLAVGKGPDDPVVAPLLPTALNSDEDWEKAIAWLRHFRLELHVPLSDPPWFRHKEPNEK